MEDLKGTNLSRAAIGNIRSKTVRNPLQVSYFSAAPFRYGASKVMRFFVEPAKKTEQLKFSDEEIKNLDPDYLAKALKTSMIKKTGENKEPIRFNFMVQVIGQRQLEIGGANLIENASIAWDEKNYPSVKFDTFKVATVSIPAVDENDAPDFVDACKPLRFTPWHALEAHEPLGGINRLRKPVYCASGEFRGGTDAADSRTRCQEGRYQ